MDYKTYWDNRKALSERMASDDNNIHEMEQKAKEFQKFGETEAADFYTNRADDYARDLNETGEKIGELDKNYWNQAKNATPDAEKAANDEKSNEADKSL